jgi:hypothetical protein
VADWSEYRIIFHPCVVLVVMENIRTITGRSEYLGTKIDWRITEPSKDFAKIFTLAPSQVEIIRTYKDK